jgi:hypothetical protein
MTESTSHLQPDGTTFPPVTPDPPPPPGYVDPIREIERHLEGPKAPAQDDDEQEAAAS